MNDSYYSDPVLTMHNMCLYRVCVAVVEVLMSVIYDYPCMAVLCSVYFMISFL